MKNISIIITSIMLLTLLLIKILSNSIDQRLAGGWLQNINVNALIIPIIISILVSILLILIDKITKEKRRNN